MKIGFVGLGAMGLPMAMNLVKGGHDVTGFDLSADALAELEKAGGTAGASGAAAAEGADLVVTMLPKAEHVEAAIFGETGILEGAGAETVLVNMSTILPEETDAISARLAGRMAMVDAPVGRSALEAKRGALLILASGSEADKEKARPAFECMGNETIDCGAIGNGSRVKIINNFMGVSLNALTAEALTLAEASGLDIRLALDVMRGTIAGIGHMKVTYPNKVLKGDLLAGFPSDLAHKDLGLAIRLAESTNVPTYMGAAALQTYSIVRAEGRGRQDYTAVYPTLRGLAGLPEAIPYDASGDEEYDPFKKD
ncbi:sulfolactaldehyde 3-reductase [Roseovarius indicus]|nr:sulfolactaldehyde 3-reductase [Roseovarius indicus]OAN99003.1 gamma-hydroxybutyrate dehydrogenase [Roseovarius indicus]QEW25505.1 2-(hydroxymethyl)glutarate dehydrogenase [Roseovarius indicus]SFE04097.1 4-hydroxybutyrate dehydrogenase / sulfolactaldehyde 3-reductase [Roseovarius indicus]